MKTRLARTAKPQDWKSYENWYEVEKPKIKDWDAVASAAFSLFEIMEALTSDLWNKID